jgi:hypothetical protein
MKLKITDIKSDKKCKMNKIKLTQEGIQTI